MSSCDDDSFSSPDKLVRRPPSRSLIFETPVKHAKDEQKEDVSDDDNILKILPESLLQSVGSSLILIYFHFVGL
jgi:chromatin licensing and DNA replication factor 1